MTASLLLGGLAAGLAIWGKYEWLAAVSAGTRLLVYLACCIACLRPAAGGAGQAAPWSGWALPVATAAAIVVLLFALEPWDVIAGIIGISIGMVAYLVARRARAAFALGGVVR